MNIVDEPLSRYAHDHTTEDPELLRRLSDETHRSMSNPQMLTGRVEGRLLKMLVQLTGAETALEVGMFTGYASLSMAEGLPPSGRLITCEINPEAVAVARTYLARSPHGRKIEIRLGPALETIANLDEPLDMAFIDADKENYPAYYETLLPKLRAGGLIVIDNVLWSGRVLDPKEATDRAIDEVNRLVSADDRVEHVLLTVRDGIHLVRKR